MIDAEELSSREKFIPDYSRSCENCGQSPVVTAVNMKSGEVTYESGMCGPCTFGEADCIDPENW
jgi:hypothetical protein